MQEQLNDKAQADKLAVKLNMSHVTKVLYALAHFYLKSLHSRTALLHNILLIVQILQLVHFPYSSIVSPRDTRIRHTIQWRAA